jgi:Pregnancy-associated plasma protein-A/Secretion system C-terminal sorting domain
MYKLLLAFTFLIGSITISSAQNFTPCLTDQIHQQAIIKNPEIIQYEANMNKLAREQSSSPINFKTGSILYIPVVFHIIHQNGVENISQAQIMNELKILNTDYRKMGRDSYDSLSTSPLAADMQIEFRLAQYDPNGNKSDGINRIYSTATVNADDGVKALSYWDSNRYLNVWVVSSINNSVSGIQGTVLGYAQFPYSRPSQPTTDGIIVKANQVGTVGIGDLGQVGRTLTHEIGHWLGLYHPFQGGCVGGTSSNCSAEGDQVCDTPPVANPSFGCTVNQNTCHNDIPDLNDLVKDYMDYANGNCMNLFTAGQKTRIYSLSFNGAASSSNRVYAASATNLSKIGIDATSGNYSFVSASTKKAPYSYDFENIATLASDGWVLNNFMDTVNGFHITSTAAQSGNSCISSMNFKIVTMNSRNGFQSPEIDITPLSTPYLNFHYAYALSQLGSNDLLNVFISDSFGMDEKIIWSNSGNSLTTAGTQTASFTPNSSQWRTVSVNLSAYKFYTHARVRFEVQNRKGNNVFIDNFSISNSATGIEESTKLLYKFNLYPNPVQSTATISFELFQNEKVKIVLFDMMGREVQIAEDSFLESGSHSITIHKGNLTEGMYFIRFEAGENTFNHKLLIN